MYSLFFRDFFYGPFFSRLFSHSLFLGDCFYNFFFPTVFSPFFLRLFLSRLFFGVNWLSLAVGNNRVKKLVHKIKIEEKIDQKISSKSSSINANARSTLNCRFYLMAHEKNIWFETIGKCIIVKYKLKLTFIFTN